MLTQDAIFAKTSIVSSLHSVGEASASHLPKPQNWKARVGRSELILGLRVPPRAPKKKQPLGCFFFAVRGCVKNPAVRHQAAARCVGGQPCKVRLLSRRRPPRPPKKWTCFPAGPFFISFSMQETHTVFPLNTTALSERSF